MVKDCWPKADEFSSCEDLLSNYMLRVCIWVLGMVSLLGNTVVVIWRVKDKRDSKVSLHNKSRSSYNVLSSKHQTLAQCCFNVNPCSAGIDFSRQNLTFVYVRF